jgi:hypothetical protein
MICISRGAPRCTLVRVGPVLPAVMRLELESSPGSNVALFGRTGGRRLLMLLHLVHHHLHQRLRTQ